MQTTSQIAALRAAIVAAPAFITGQLVRQRSYGSDNYDVCVTAYLLTKNGVGAALLTNLHAAQVTVRNFPVLASAYGLTDAELKALQYVNDNPERSVQLWQVGGREVNRNTRNRRGASARVLSFRKPGRTPKDAVLALLRRWEKAMESSGVSSADRLRTEPLRSR